MGGKVDFQNWFEVEEKRPEPLFNGSITSGLNPTQALDALHTEYADRLYHFALSVLRNPHDAEDAVQTTFMNAYGSLVDGRSPQTDSSWLFRIARNVCLNRIRTRQRKPASTLDGMDVAQLQTTEDRVVDLMHIRALKSAIQGLPANQRKAILMRELEGASYAEIAERMDTTQSAVESLIFRARRHLVSILENSGVAPVAA